MNDEDFYEDDEPVADVLVAFEAGEKAVTGRIQWGFDVRSGQKVRAENLQIIERQGVTVSR